MHQQPALDLEIGATTPAAPTPGAAPTPPAQPSVPALSPPFIPLATAWPRSAQLALGLLILSTVGLMTWDVYARSRWATRPTVLDVNKSDVFRIDLNRADRVQLLQLPSAGDNLVARIEAYRREHGGFRNVEELRRVSGVGPVLLERWRTQVYVSTPESDADSDGADKAAMPLPRVVRGARPDAETTPIHTRGKRSLKPGESIDINRASVAELQRLPGIGPALAARIVDARGRKAFTAIADLKRVSGIGKKTIGKLRPFVRVE